MSTGREDLLSVDDLQKEINDLKRRLEELERRVIPVAPQPFPDQIHTLNRCHKCGLHISNVMGYVCGDQACPIFPKTT